MTIEEAILTALTHEERVRDHYANSEKLSPESGAKGFFGLMAREEQSHVEYLRVKLEQWQSEGRVEPTALATAIPNSEWLRRGVAAGGEASGGRPPQAVLERLYAALEMEEAVSEYYRGLVDAVGDRAAAAMFQRFLEIEDGHTAVVQAEIDQLTRTGYFFDVQEFTLDG